MKLWMPRFKLRMAHLELQMPRLKHRMPHIKLQTSRFKLQMPHMKHRMPHFKLQMPRLKLRMTHLMFTMPHSKLHIRHLKHRMPRLTEQRFRMNPAMLCCKLTAGHIKLLLMNSCLAPAVFVQSPERCSQITSLCCVEFQDKIDRFVFWALFSCYHSYLAARSNSSKQKELGYEKKFICIRIKCIISYAHLSSCLFKGSWER